MGLLVKNVSPDEQEVAWNDETFSIPSEAIVDVPPPLARQILLRRAAEFIRVFASDAEYISPEDR
jgi:hypothetical protein